MSMLKTLGASALALAALVAPRTSAAGTFTTLYAFNPATDGCVPIGAMYYYNGSIYGADYYCGTGEGWGTIFALQLSRNTEKTLFAYNYGNLYGVWPSTVSGSGSTLFGVADYGGTSPGQGAITEFDLLNGKAVALHDFPSSNIDGYSPAAVVEIGKVLYGVTTQGGTYGAGVLFSIDTSTKVETVLHQFTNGADGGNPFSLLKADGVIYGAAPAGGTAGFGVIFKYDPSSATESVVYNFNPVRGGPRAGITYGDGKLWGVTSGLYGTVFSVDPTTGAEKDIYYFTGGTDGGASGPLTYYNGLLYGEGTGTAPYGYAPIGDLYSVDPKTGKETTLYSFTGGNDGKNPNSQLLVVDGNLYGTAQGGANNGGTIFEYTP